MILAADIGGTHTRLMLCNSERQPVRQAVFASREYATFEAVLAQFLTPDDRIKAACFAVAGPVLQQRCAVTHLPWVLDAAALQAHYGFPVVLINDFVAKAHGLPALSAQDLLTLQAGEPQAGGVQLLVGAGTGLGIATRILVGTQVQVVESEGGHADFAPHGEQQSAMHAALRARLGAVYMETVVSGKGLQHVYQYTNGFSDNVFSDNAMAMTAAAISAAAHAGDASAVAAMDLFMECYGSTAGNLALVNVPLGGVYITGGVAAKNAAFIGNGRFLAAFRDKPNMRALLEKVPVHVVLDEKLGVLGAARYAAAWRG